MAAPWGNGGNRWRREVALLVWAALLGARLAGATIFPGPAEVVGRSSLQEARKGESLIEVARSHDLGFNEIAAANPGLDPFVPTAGSPVTIPGRHVVPAAVVPGRLVVNLSELRLYFVPEGGTPRIVSFPVGTGSEGKETPLGVYRVTEKRANPAWHVPLSIRQERPRLPAVVPPGPDNPLGSHALRLTDDGLMIHGTNRPWGVGRNVSHGCIRLYPEDIPVLFRLVSPGTPVAIVREPVKVGDQEGRLLIEVHRDEGAGIDYAAEATRLIMARGRLDRVDFPRLFRALAEKRGVPVDIGR
ncbi:L,D-transpeptidase family protein [Geobacter grbiciae]|uniref:L,D-transpeptidase family protein n=1 Tax=Geobacter grbiciae TaxID=155042 RepID=UPI001C01A5BD|nr:L,D-transpeptidase family protein [Geobacter grbiciae]MBT1074949.1 L,D-transpeptidase family protein [Geobacter grbiciae]